MQIPNSVNVHVRQGGILVAVSIAYFVPVRDNFAEDGYDLWLRYRPIAEAGRRDPRRRGANTPVVQGGSPTAQAVRDELQRGLDGLLGGRTSTVGTLRTDGGLVAGTLASPRIARLGWRGELTRL